MGRIKRLRILLVSTPPGKQRSLFSYNTSHGSSEWTGGNHSGPRNPSVPDARRLERPSRLVIEAAGLEVRIFGTL
jgi:hypothetical protein